MIKKITIEHKRKYGVYHWDTFDNTTLLLFEHDKKQRVIDYVLFNYAGRLKDTGADQVDIVNKNGDIVKRFKVC